MPQPVQQPIAQRAQADRLVGQFRGSDLRRPTEARHQRHRQRARAQAALLAAAGEQRLQAHPRPAADIQRADALGAVHLVGAERGEVETECLDVGRDLAGGLGEVGMQQRARRAHQRRKTGHVLHHAGLVVHRHDADQQRGRAQRVAQAVGIEPAIRLHRKYHRLEAFVSEVAHGLQHAGMLGRQRDDPAACIAIGAQVAHRTLDRQVVALGGARGQHHAARIGADQVGDGRACPVAGVFGIATHPVLGTVRVAVAHAEERQHGIDHAGIARRRGLVVEIDHAARVAGCDAGPAARRM